MKLRLDRVVDFAIYLALGTMSIGVFLVCYLGHVNELITIPFLSMAENQLPEQALMQFGLLFVGILFVVLQTSFHYKKMPEYGDRFAGKMLLRTMLVCGCGTGIFLGLQSLIPLSLNWNKGLLDFTIETHFNLTSTLHYTSASIFFMFAFLHMITSVAYSVFIEKTSLKTGRIAFRIACILFYSVFGLFLLYVTVVEFPAKRAKNASPVSFQELNIFAFVEIVAAVIIMLYFRSFRTELKEIQIVTLAPKKNEKSHFSPKENLVSKKKNAVIQKRNQKKSKNNKQKKKNK
ncbi:hypothetical protein M0813_17321 [Anaeramoeba flamelloides]|uniref:CWH43-like N-terminal domain-containing protein n=1 Tax=Anaeramoeba flamelloides TaxID=1746091 RepID=A0ABQ8YW39_9EUKA|nr:hypothetical protein M0813_17321 [Anaeramoeba flamelloides]